MNELFILTRDTLMICAEWTGLSYKEINVYVWYFCIPCSWALLLDLIVSGHRAKTTAIVLGLAGLAALWVTDATAWLFDRSCEFLLLSNIGGNYINASVWICLAVPLLVYAILIPWAAIRVFTHRRARRNLST